MNFSGVLCLSWQRLLKLILKESIAVALYRFYNELTIACECALIITLLITLLVIIESLNVGLSSLVR